MGKGILLLLILILGCAPPAPEPFLPPDTKTAQRDTSVSLLDKGVLTEYDIWEFLKSGPSEDNLFHMLGRPDSVWVSDEDPYYILYYYRPHLEDYNSIELNKEERKVTGYEWDE